MDVITDSIDIWTSAQIAKTNGRGKSAENRSSHGIKKLRELILELAVRGKLVPQDSNDEPTSVLLEKISKEKARLIKKGKIKKQKPLPKISDEEKSFQIPEGWEWVRLGDIGNIYNGNSISVRIKEEKYTNIGGGLPFIATKDVSYGWDSFSYNNGVSIPLNEPKFKVAHKGAVLICAEGGSAGKKCGITDQDICFGNKLFANELYSKIEPYLILANYLSPTFFAHFSEQMTGIIGGISSAKFSQLLVPLPPLSEQHRIVVKVDKLMALCDQLEQQQTNSNSAHQTLVKTLLDTLTSAADQEEFAEAWQRIANHVDTLFTTEHSIDQLKQTILQLAVMGKLVPQDPKDEPVSKLLEKITKEKARLIKEGKIKKQKPLPEIRDDEKPFELPEKWEWVRLGNLNPDFQNGASSRGDKEGLKIVVLRLADINNWRVSLEDTRSLIINEKKIDKYFLKTNDVLIIRVNGSADIVGRFILCDREFNAIYCDHFIRMRFPIEDFSPAYIELLGSSKLIRNSISKLFITTAGQKTVNQKHISSLLVTLPPLTEQHRIVAKVDELMVLCDTLKERLNDAQTTNIQLADAIVGQAMI